MSHFIIYISGCCAVLSCVRLFATPWTVACQDPLSMGILQARILEWVAMPSSTGSSQPRIKPRSPALRVNSLPLEPPRKPKNTGLGSLFLLQGIFLIQELNQGLLHCRQILYQQSYQGSPYKSGYRASNRDNYTHHMFLENKDIFISSSFSSSLSLWFFWSSSMFKFGTQMWLPRLSVLWVGFLT